MAIINQNLSDSLNVVKTNACDNIYSTCNIYNRNKLWSLHRFSYPQKPLDFLKGIQRKPENAYHLYIHTYIQYTFTDLTTTLYMYILYLFIPLNIFYLN